MKRSHEPLAWLLFGAGGMLAALLAPALVLIVGLAGPLGWLPAEALSAGRLRALLLWPGARLLLGLTLALFLWHAAHRIRHSLHDLGVHAGPWGGWVCYGSAVAASLWAAWLLLGLGA